MPICGGNAHKDVSDSASPTGGAEDATAPTRSGFFSFLKKKGNGRLEPPPAPVPEAATITEPEVVEATPTSPERLYSRDGLHSAPTRRSPAPEKPTADDTEAVAETEQAPKSESPLKSRMGLHSAPPLKRIPSTVSDLAMAYEPPRGIDEFVVEKASSRTADEVRPTLSMGRSQAPRRPPTVIPTTRRTLKRASDLRRV